MIDENQVSEAVQKVVVNGGLPYPIVFEAEDTIPTRPYITLQIVRLPPRAVMLETHDGVTPQYLQATVVTETGKFATQGLQIAKDIASLYPFGLRLSVGSGHEATVNSIPFIETGFRDGPDWRTPVRINYEVE